MSDYLKAFSSEHFRDQICYTSDPVLLRHLIVKTDEFSQAQEAMQCEALSEEAIRDYVDTMMRGFRSHERFRQEWELSAIAILLENTFTDFAEEFLSDLSRLKLAELNLPIQVAREAVERRSQEQNMRSFNVTPITFGEIPNLVVFEIKASAAFDNMSMKEAQYA